MVGGQHGGAGHGHGAARVQLLRHHHDSFFREPADGRKQPGKLVRLVELLEPGAIRRPSLASRTVLGQPHKFGQALLGWQAVLGEELQRHGEAGTRGATGEEFQGRVRRRTIHRGQPRQEVLLGRRIRRQRGEARQQAQLQRRVHHAVSAHVFEHGLAHP